MPRPKKRISYRKRLEVDNNRHYNKRKREIMQENNSLRLFPFQLLPKDVRAGKAFDVACESIKWIECSNCPRKFPDLHVNFENKCISCSNEENITKFTSQNYMDPGEIPEELKDLTYIEEMLIAQIHPIISLYRIKGAQYAYSGNVINFRQAIENYIKVLPINPYELPSTIIFNKNMPTGVTQFRVRASRIRNALVWLKRNNVYYRNIEISEHNINLLPEDGDIVNMLKSCNIDDNLEQVNDYVEESNILNLQNVNQSEIISNELELDYPVLDCQPIDEFNSEGYIVRAFPALFPSGNCDLLQARNIKITETEYYRYLMTYKDGRFAKDARFRFFALNSLMRHDALNKANIYIKKSVFKESDIRHVKEKVNDDNLLLKNIMLYTPQLRSTKPYWKQKSSELLQMVLQIGKPTVFFTLSAADYHWHSIFKLMSPTPQISSLSDKERRNFMHENPLLVAFCFQKRCELFMKYVLKPLFGVDDFWYRFEWQSRGSPHVHGLLWLKDEPKFNSDINNLTDDDQNAIRAYFEKICFAYNVPNEPQEIHPSRFNFSDIKPEEFEDDLAQLLNRLQKHTEHGQHCLRKVNHGKELRCRFNFPKPTCETSYIDDSEGYLVFCPQRNDATLCRYNPVVTQIWRANTDFSPVLSTDAVIRYVSKYVSKAEKSSKDYVDILNTLCNEDNIDLTSKNIIRKLILSTIGDRDYSAQEVMHVLMGWPLYHSSRQFITLSIKDDLWTRLKFMENEQSTLIENYIARPQSLSNISLLTFAKTISLIKKTYRTRRKEVIVRIFPILQLSGVEEEDEKYYKLQCILNIPFVGFYDDLLNNSTEITWKGLFEAHQLEHQEQIDISNDTEEGEVLEGSNDNVYQSVFEVLSSCPNESRNTQIGHRLIDVNYKWNLLNDILESLDVSTFLKTYRQSFIKQTNNVRRSISFSKDQQKVLDTLNKQINNISNSPHFNVNKRTIVQGKAGSGKSTLIHRMVELIELAFGEGAVLVLAPTGAASITINGVTIHFGLNLPLLVSNFSSLTGSKARSFQLRYKNLKFLIIDEMSMIGAKLMYQIEKRCREIFPSVDEPFGGLYVYLLGDYRQLPPVGDAPIYSRKPTTDKIICEGRLAFDTFQLFIELEHSHRQKNSSCDFPALLDRLGRGSITQEDYELLSTRREAVLSETEKSLFNNAINILPTNEMVNGINEDYLKRNGSPVARIASVNIPDVRMSVKSDSSIGLHSILYLSIGCRIMLRSNLFTEGGLINGSFGTVEGIIYSENCGPPALPICVLVKFDHYDGPYIYNSLFPIIPITRTWYHNGILFSRKQIPLSVSYGATIHKSQGLTLDQAVVDIGPTEFQIGGTYSCLTRVRDVKDIIFRKFYSKSRFDAIGKSCRLKEREDMIKLLRLKS